MPTPPRYDGAAQDALMTGQLLTGERRLAQFEPEALVAALLEDPDGPASRILRGVGLDPGVLRDETARALERMPTLQYGTEVSIASTRLRAVLSRAEIEAARTGVDVVGVDDVLVGLLLAGDTAVARHLGDRGVSAEALHRVANQGAATSSASSDVPVAGESVAVEAPTPDVRPAASAGTPPAPPTHAPGGAVADPVAAHADALLAESLRVTATALAVLAGRMAGAADAGRDRADAAAIWLTHAPALLERLDTLSRRPISARRG